jgi:hypothetical protein
MNKIEKAGLIFFATGLFIVFSFIAITPKPIWAILPLSFMFVGVITLIFSAEEY